MLICYLGVSHYYNTILNNETKIALHSELDELSIKKIIINDFYTRLVEDINLLTWQHSNTISSSPVNSIKKQANFFKRFSSILKSYDQVRLLDTLGNEIIRIDLDTQDRNLFIEQNNLQNKGERYYFQSAKKLSPNEIYFSRIDLNFENGQIETPYKPVIRVAKKTYDSKGNCTGIIITNHFITHLSNKLLTYDENIDSSFEMINKQGYWLMANNPDLTFGHIKPQSDSISLPIKRSKLWSEIQGKSKGFYQSKEYSYAFIRFAPPQKLDSKLIFEIDEEFILISKVKNSDIRVNAPYYNQMKWISFILLAILFASLIIGIQFSRTKLVKKNKILKESQAELTFLKEKLENNLELKLNELAITEQKFYSLFNNAGIGVALVNLKGKPEFSNGTFCNILGYSAEELSVKTFQEFTYSEDIEKDTRLFNKLIKKQITGYNIEKRYVRKDGKVIWVDLHVSLLLNNDSEIENIIATVSEITDKKHYQEKLFDNAQVLNQIFEAVLAMDHEGIITYWNKGAVKLFGHSSEEILGCHIDVLCPKNNHSNPQTGLLKDFFTSNKKQTEIQLTKKDGTIFTAQLSLSNRYDSHGNNIGSIGSILDISIQKEHEQKILQINNQLEQKVEKRTQELKKSYLQIKENEYRLNAAFNGGEYGWWDQQTLEQKMITHPSRFIFIGYKEEEINDTITWWREQIHPDDIEKTDHLYKEMYSGKTDSYKQELRLKHKKGHYIWVYDQGTVIARDEKGFPKRIIGTTQNIDQRKKAELDRLKLSKAVEQSQVVVEITDKHGIIEYVNPAFENLTGYSPEEVIGKNPKILNAKISPKKIYKDLWQTILKGETWEGELCNQTKDGRVFWETAIISPIKNENGKIINFIAVKEDITEKREFVEKLKLAKTEAEEANNAKSEFLANMSHEIRTPMNAVIGFTDILYRQIKSPTQRQYLNSIKVSGKNLLSIINDILDLSKIESGKMKIESSIVDLSQLLSELKATFQRQAIEKGLDFYVEIDKNVCSTISSDEIRIKQILFNLLSNAIKFTEQGHISVKVKSDIIIDGKDQSEGLSNIQFIVEDTGIGVKEEMQKKIFESFIQQDGQDSKKYGGTGLGLTISKKLAHMLGGDISLKSISNQGSTFTLSLKEIKCPLSSKDDHDRTETNSEIVFESKRILVVDDISTNREYMKSALEELGLVVSLATDGMKAYQSLENEKTDLIICDLKMPVLDGYGFIKKLKSSKHQHIPCIVATASALQEELEEIRRNDFDGVLFKPIQLDELIGELMKHLTYNIQQKTARIHTEPLEALSKQELQLINQELNTLILPLYEEIKNRQSFDKLKKFADALSDAGTTYSIKTLSLYAKEFRESIDSFNIENILKLINTFGSWVKD
ncbi:PAS domain S-box protein [Saccharicrinis fermentans]|uniref:PAS domain S-box protein n=1 Tax=Saccharicrinis fermentans TaxID=982 RepID=UPI0004B3919D|nr:PAS domain S-box protein [Saccharicrinis fermentans]